MAFLNKKVFSFFSLLAVSVLDGSIGGHEVTLTLLPAADASQIENYVVLYKTSNVRREWKIKRTKRTQVILRSLRALTEYTVMVVGYTPSKKTYGSNDLKFTTLNGE